MGRGTIDGKQRGRLVYITEYRTFGRSIIILRISSIYKIYFLRILLSKSKN